MPQYYDLDPQAQARQDAARRAVAGAWSQDPTSLPTAEGMAAAAALPEAAPGPPPDMGLPEPELTAAPAVGAPAASPTSIRHEGFGGYTYAFDPISEEISILVDPKGRVPAGYVVPMDSVPYTAIRKELAEAGKAEPKIDSPDLEDPKEPVTWQQGSIPEIAGADVFSEVGSLEDEGFAPLAGGPPPEGVKVYQPLEIRGEVPLSAGAAEGEPSLEDMEDMLGRLTAEISKRRKAAREGGKEKAAAVAAAPPAAGGTGAQAPPEAEAERKRLFHGGGGRGR